MQFAQKLLLLIRYKVLTGLISLSNIPRDRAASSMEPLNSSNSCTTVWTSAAELLVKDTLAGKAKTLTPQAENTVNSKYLPMIIWKKETRRVLQAQQSLHCWKLCRSPCQGQWSGGHKAPQLWEGAFLFIWLPKELGSVNRDVLDTKSECRSF